MTVLLFNEIFRSFQGEGPSMGQSAVFLRLANCNLSCSWCDTRYSWDWAQFDPDKERRKIGVDTLLEQLISELGQLQLLIVTGGEPLLQQTALVELLLLLKSALPGVRVEVETNGTIAPTAEVTELIDLFVVSPKLSNSSLSAKRRVRPSALRAFPPNRTALKFVVTDINDLGEVAEIREIAGVPPGKTWIMPEGSSPEAVISGLRALSSPAVERGLNLSPRLHVLVWGDARGV